VISTVFARHSLKTRITFTTLAIFLISLWSLAFYASRMLRVDMERLLGEQQFSTASIVAAHVNEELDGRFRALANLAQLLAPLMSDTVALQALLDRQTALQDLFNGGIIADRLDGTAIGEIPLSAGRVGVNYMDVDTIVAALKRGESTVGRPVMGRTLHAPVVTMATPIRDGRGKVIGALAGVVNLGRSNFLDKITEGHYGKSGGYILVAAQHRLIVTATDKSRIMQPLSAPGIVPQTDRFIDGFEGYAVYSNPRGEEVLNSSKRIPVAAWNLAVTMPTAEAFAPIRVMQQRMLLATVLLTLLAGGITWWLLRRQLAPMTAAARALAIQSDLDQPMRPLPIARRDEIGELVGGFNQMLEALGKREAVLMESESRFRRAIEEAPFPIMIYAEDGAVLTISRTWTEISGYRLHDIPTIGDWTEKAYGERKAVIRSYFNKLFDLKGRLAEGEYQVRCRNGDDRIWEFSAVGFGHMPDGRRIAISIAMDVTERKRMESSAERERTRLQTILRMASDGIHILDGDGLLVEANAAFLNMLGYDESAIGKLRVKDWDALATSADTKARIDDLLTRRGSAVFETRHRRRDGRTLDIEINTSAIEIEGQAFIYAAARDITARKQAEQELRVAATAFESQEGMFVTDAHNVILRVNQAFTDITGYTAAEAVGETPNLLNSGRHDEAFYARMWESLRDQGAWQGEIWNRRKNGEVFPEWLTITAVKGSAGENTHYVATLTDITRRKAAEEEIKHLAFYDPLTRLPNRRLLLDRLHQALASSARSGREGALLFIDLDNFKTLNDTLGHYKGDLLLQQVAQRLVTCIREGDTVARLGGDEFVVMLEDLSSNPKEAATQCETVGEKIIATLNQIYQLAGHEHHSTPSIGITLFNDINSVDELLKRADLAMYQAKAAGRNTLRFFDPEMQALVTNRAALETDLRHGLEEDQFVIYYQAQVREDGTLLGAEVLVRWQHPERGLVSPAEFIPLAEETWLILRLGHWVLETACAQLAAWAADSATADLSLAVNVSARQFHQADFVDQVLAVLAQTGANPRRLKLELTESLLLDDVQDIIAKMTALKAEGVGFSLDDFGTGYSSLSYLKRLPLDQLKIDQSFVRSVFHDANDAAIAQMIIALSQTMGLSVIAEGVETEEQRDFLSRLGCLAYQGYLFSRPLPLHEFKEFLIGR